MKNLADDVHRQQDHLTTGNLCTKYLMEMLTRYGEVDCAYRLATQTTYPSWGFMLENGATTLWERWEYATGDAMNSHNHPMMGSVDTWFYKYLLGIAADSEHPGFDRFTLHPYLPEELQSAEGSLQTVKGVIRSAWKKQKNVLEWNVTVPANSMATLWIPTSRPASVKEGGRSVSRVASIRPLQSVEGYALYEVGSGDYRFTAALK